MNFIAWNSCATHMHHTSNTLYFKEYNLLIKHGLPLKLELTDFIDTFPHKVTVAMCIFQQVMRTGLTLNVYISTLPMCWFQQTMSSKLTKHSTFITTHSIIHDQVFVFKKCFCKNCYIFNKMSESKIFLG